MEESLRKERTLIVIESFKKQLQTILFKVDQIDKTTKEFEIKNFITKTCNEYFLSSFSGNITEQDIFREIFPVMIARMDIQMQTEIDELFIDVIDDLDDIRSRYFFQGIRTLNKLLWQFLKGRAIYLCNY